MNRLSFDKRVAIAACALDGMSERSISRRWGMSCNAVSRNLLSLGEACQRYHDKYDRNLKIETVQMDELTSLIRGRDKKLSEGVQNSPNYGMMWNWVGFCPKTKFSVSWFCGKHELMDAEKVCFDLRARIATPSPQIFTDGLIHYHAALETAFGDQLRHGTIMKVRDESAKWDQASPEQAPIKAMRKGNLVGDIDEAQLSTSGVERFNLTLRMESARYRKLSNTISKELKFHRAATALKMMGYNYLRMHQTIRCTPAMEVGLISKLWNVYDFVSAMDSVPDSEASPSKKLGSANPKSPANPHDGLNRGK